MTKLLEAEVLQSKGHRIQEAYRRMAITEQTRDKWHMEYGGLRVEQAKRLKHLGQENSRI